MTEPAQSSFANFAESVLHALLSSSRPDFLFVTLSCLWFRRDEIMIKMSVHCYAFWTVLHAKDMCCVFQCGLLLVGCERGRVSVYTTETFEKVHELETGTIRYRWYFHLFLITALMSSLVNHDSMRVVLCRNVIWLLCVLDALLCGWIFQIEFRFVSWTKTLLDDRLLTVAVPCVWNMLPALLHFIVVFLRVFLLIMSPRAHCICVPYVHFKT